MRREQNRKQIAAQKTRNRTDHPHDRESPHPIPVTPRAGPPSLRDNVPFGGRRKSVSAGRS
jgi:hypothetical protein